MSALEGRAVVHAGADVGDRADIGDRCVRRQFGDQSRQFPRSLRVVPQNAEKTLTKPLPDLLGGQIVPARPGIRQLVAHSQEFALRVLVHSRTPEPPGQSQLGLLPRLRHHQPGQSCHRRCRECRQLGFH